MGKCFEAYEQTRSDIQALRGEFNAKAEAIKARETELQGIEGELAIMDPASSQFAERSFKWESEKLTIERDRKFLTELLKRRQMELMYGSYLAVQAAAAELAARDGYGAVLIIPEQLPARPQDWMSAMDVINTRSVLWPNPNYDVTEQVLLILNGIG